MTDTTSATAANDTDTVTATTTTNQDQVSIYRDLLTFLQSPQRADLRLEATKAVLQCSPDRDQSLALIDHGVLKALLKVISMGGGVAANRIGNTSHKSDNTHSMIVQASINALQTLLFWTSSVQEMTNMVVDRLLECQTVPRLVELILGFPACSSNSEVQSVLSKESKQIINFSLGILANLSRTEQGALELVGTTLPEEAVYNNRKESDNAEHSQNDASMDTTRIKPTMELLLDRFVKTTPTSVADEELKEAMATLLEAPASSTSQNEWDTLWYPFDPYQHFAAILMNSTQVKAGRQFVMRIPRSAASNAEGVSVLQRLLPQMAPPASFKAITNPFRRRGISGMIRNCCLEKESAWWLLNICKIITPLLLPLAGPEELELEDKRGMDPDLWMRGPDQQRDIDISTRLHCVEAILLLCATGRANRNTLRTAKTYVILKHCDMVEESEEVSDRINECVQYLRRDEEGTAEGSSDQLAENGGLEREKSLDASSSTRIEELDVEDEIMQSTSDTSSSSVIRDYSMAPALPVSDPDKVRPIQRKVKIVGTQQQRKRNNFQDRAFEIELDDEERQLFSALQEVARELEDGLIEGYSKKKVQVRVAGGWVRDKILGLQTHDVDIALDTCTGVEFATIMKQHVESSAKQQNNDAQSKKLCGKIGVIAANPAQSKHLETATMRIFGIEVDFSNLRHETYAEDSRIPETVTGTALEDAYRRDFTMNSLYYNLSTQSIEDWTRRGLQDLLDTKVVQTPLEAYQTFHDDPLRVLRAIRFAVRYHMRLSEDLMQACQHPQIHNELHRKVSRERVGKELEGMLSGKHANPIKAMDLICSLKLAGGVFCLPDPEVNVLGSIAQDHLEDVPYRGEDEQQLAHLREHAWEEARECMKILPLVLNALKVQPDGSLNLESMEVDEAVANMTPVDTRLVYLSVILLPYRRLQYIFKNKTKNVVEYMMRDGIKFKNKDVLAMTSLTEGMDEMMQLLQRTPDTSPTSRLQAGLFLRSTKDMWVTTLVAATVAQMRKRQSIQVSWCRRAKDWYDAIVKDMDLDNCWSRKPLLNGKDLIQLLGLEKGPAVGVYTEEQSRWRLMNPKGSLDELICHLKDFQKAREFEENQAAQHISKKMHL
ncbi:tRNA nucleotidyltransferase/CCA-adding enzyme [Nitzschia inconspicua]|uniref:tRNA nucleotidyltransferase/CCA-adding enzyme n=1 Tax=Nitzschia inconspicua TaxID=303405 RepID=A0A9K3L3I0_9STRA|nr:tRNA nucleotidyltransferase/CCA-adding enzyme [Nitzschia inconspicua]